MANFHVLQISVCLPCADKEDWLTSSIGHGQCCADFVVNSIKLGQDHAVDMARIGASRKVLERRIELCQLVHSLITDQSLTDKYDLIWVVDCYQLPHCSRQTNT